MNFSRLCHRLYILTSSCQLSCCVFQPVLGCSVFNQHLVAWYSTSSWLLGIVSRLDNGCSSYTHMSYHNSSCSFRGYSKKKRQREENDNKKIEKEIEVLDAQFIQFKQIKEENEIMAKKLKEVFGLRFVCFKGDGGFSHSVKSLKQLIVTLGGLLHKQLENRVKLDK